MCLIFELLYKLGIRVGEIAKTMVKDINKEGIITFKEKNQKKIKRKHSDKLLQKIIFQISSYNLKMIFYFIIITKINLMIKEQIILV